MPRKIRKVFVAAVLVLVASSVRAQEATPPDQDQNARPKAIEYSEGYETRAKIHRIASWATLPLLGTEVVLGQSLYNDPLGLTSGTRTAHIAVGTAITGLFAVNSVTGIWNLVESRKDPNHRTLRLVHGIMMLGADAGFVAAFGTGPGGRRLADFDSSKQTHRTIALTSIGVAASSYLMMIIANH